MTKKKSSSNAMIIALNTKKFIARWLHTAHRTAYSVPECAEAVGISESTLYMIESGKRVPGLEVYFSMCLWSGLDPCEYIIGVNEMMEKGEKDFFAKYPPHTIRKI